MKKLLRMLCGILIAFTVVISGLNIGEFEVKAAEKIWNINYRDMCFRYSGSVTNSFELNPGDTWKVNELNIIPHDASAPVDRYHHYVLSIKKYDLNSAGNGLSIEDLKYINDAAPCPASCPTYLYSNVILSPSLTFNVDKKYTVKIKANISNTHAIYVGLYSDDALEYIKTYGEDTVAVHNHSYIWRVTQKGSPEKDQIEQQVCSNCGAKGETRTTSAYTFFLEEANNELLVKNTPAGETAEITTKVFNVFPKSLMEAVAERRDIDVVFTYKYDGKNIQVTIPAGTEVDISCEYYGPAKMMSLYGYKELPYFPGEIVASTIPELVNAQAGATVTLTGKNAYSIADMLAISDRSDVNVDLEVTYDGKNYLIHIPSGTAIDLSCDWYGPAKLMSLYAYDEK